MWASSGRRRRDMRWGSFRRARQTRCWWGDCCRSSSCTSRWWWRAARPWASLQRAGPCGSWRTAPRRVFSPLSIRPATCLRSTRTDTDRPSSGKLGKSDRSPRRKAGWCWSATCSWGWRRWCSRSGWQWRDHLESGFLQILGRKLNSAILTVSRVRVRLDRAARRERNQCEQGDYFGIHVYVRFSDFRLFCGSWRWTMWQAVSELADPRSYAKHVARLMLRAPYFNPQKTLRCD